ncbi:MAG TPA: hypothetical protein PKE45_08235, partial [Caldilineaceae bacterium]|nr:hypothetical protein [Caldilineaceae bacterium]
MRRLCLFLVSIGLSSYGFYLIASQDSIAPYIVRDGLLLALAGAGLFALQATPAPAAEQADQLDWRAWLTLGLIIVVAAGVRFWRLASLPASCLESECERALGVAAGGAT